MAVLMAERVDRPSSLFGLAPEKAAVGGDAPAKGGDAGLGGRLTLDETIVGVWEGLVAQVTVACPVCGGALQPRARAAGGAAGGHCRDCGTTLD